MDAVRPPRPPIRVRDATMPRRRWHRRQAARRCRQFAARADDIGDECSSAEFDLTLRLTLSTAAANRRVVTPATDDRLVAQRLRVGRFRTAARVGRRTGSRRSRSAASTMPRPDARTNSPSSTSTTRCFVYRAATAALTAQVPDAAHLDEVTLARHALRRRTICCCITTDLPDPDAYKIIDLHCRDARRQARSRSPPSTPRLRRRRPCSTKRRVDVARCCRPSDATGLGPRRTGMRRFSTRIQLDLSRCRCREQQAGVRIPASTRLAHPELVVLGEHWTTPPPSTASASSSSSNDAVGEWTASARRHVDESGAVVGVLERQGLVGARVDDRRHAEPEDDRRRAVHGSGRHRANRTGRARRTSGFARGSIGGDYGQEKVTVTTKDLGDNKTEQTVERIDGRHSRAVGRRSSTSPIASATPSGRRSCWRRTAGRIAIRAMRIARRARWSKRSCRSASMLGRLAARGRGRTPTAADECPPDVSVHGATPAAAATARGAAGRHVVRTTRRGHRPRAADRPDGAADRRRRSTCCCSSTRARPRRARADGHRSARRRSLRADRRRRYDARARRERRAVDGIRGAADAARAVRPDAHAGCG